MSRRDLEFLLFEWLDTDALLGRERFAEHSRDTVEAVLALAETVATEHFAPHNRAADLAEPTFDGSIVHVLPEVEKALRTYAEAGFLSARMDEEVGGLGLPLSVYGACSSWFYAANTATTGYALLTVGAANLIAAHGTPDQVERYVVPMGEGRFFGTMALSEPHAGSNLADLTTRAEPQPDGTYRVFGRKMWISGGDHEMAENIVHLVLARTPGAPPGRGASRCSSCRRSWSPTTARWGSATTWPSSGSTTRWGSGAPSTRLRSSATAPSLRAVRRGRSGTWSGPSTRACG